MGKLTEGQHRVGVNFNPSGNTMVDEIKSRSAELIDLLSGISADRNHPGARCASEAMTGFEGAAMWAVKAVTKTPNLD